MRQVPDCTVDSFISDSNLWRSDATELAWTVYMYSFIIFRRSLERAKRVIVAVDEACSVEGCLRMSKSGVRANAQFSDGTSMAMLNAQFSHAQCSPVSAQRTSRVAMCFGVAARDRAGAHKSTRCRQDHCTLYIFSVGTSKTVGHISFRL